MSDKTALEGWVGDFVEIRILGPTGGVQVGGVLRPIMTEDGEEDPILLVAGDAILARGTEVEVLDDGTLRVDWTLFTGLRAVGLNNLVDILAEEIEEDEEGDV